jgi:hypothetical protein
MAVADGQRLGHRLGRLFGRYLEHAEAELGDLGVAAERDAWNSIG